jgi:hypothetical protein
VSLYLAVVLAVPAVALVGGGPRVRWALLVSLPTTWAVTLYAYERFVPDREELQAALWFFLLWVHVVIAPVAGTLAMLLVPRSRGLALPMVAALVGSVSAVALRYVVPTVMASERIQRALDVAGPVAVATTAAVVVATLTARRARA